MGVYRVHFVTEAAQVELKVDECKPLIHGGAGVHPARGAGGAGRGAGRGGAAAAQAGRVVGAQRGVGGVLP